MTVPLKLCDTKAGRLTGKNTLGVKTNIALDKIRVDINRHYQEVMQTDGLVTADKVKNAYLGLGVQQDTTKDNKVFPVPSNSTCNNILKLTGKQCAIKTLLTYHCGPSYIRYFINYLTGSSD